jgi:hypothetical protein
MDLNGVSPRRFETYSGLTLAPPYLDMTMYGSTVSLGMMQREVVVTALGPEVLLPPLHGIEIWIVLKYMTLPHLYHSIVESKTSN